MPDEITIEQVDLENDDHVTEAVELIARFSEELGTPLD